MRDIGISWGDLEKYIEDNIYTLPGIFDHREKLTILLTGSRAIGRYSENSDVDIDIVCPRNSYNQIQAEMFKRNLTGNIHNAFYRLPEVGWDKYFGERTGQPHFTITPIDIIEKDINEYQDTALWIWTNALIIQDPNNQFKNIINKFDGYPEDILKQKIKYRYLLASYWLIDGYPHNHSKNEELFSAVLSLINGIHELYRFFFIIEGKPYPYSEKLPSFVAETKLGKRFKPFLDKIFNMTIGLEQGDKNVWERLDKAIELILYGNISRESVEFFDACDEAVIEAGIDEAWVKSGYDNVDELLRGELGPIP
jgi:hypothetical protein